MLILGEIRYFFAFNVLLGLRLTQQIGSVVRKGGSVTRELGEGGKGHWRPGEKGDVYGRRERRAREAGFPR